MHVLVLDTIHGGSELSAAYAGAGHAADAVDVYRGTTPAVSAAALCRRYDLVAAPVHLDPDNPLLAGRTEPVITHHEAVRRLLGDRLPRPMIEVTGSQGKTTTAHAIAHLLPGAGVLHTSAGTCAYPQKTLLFKRSITPASLLAAAGAAVQQQGWLVAEVSLGVTGAGDLAVITSPEDYRIANGKRSAIRAKVASADPARHLLVADGVPCDRPDAIRVSDIARCEGTECTVEWKGRRSVIPNALFLLAQYRTPLMLAAAAALILRLDPAPLAGFAALPGRMSLHRAGAVLIVDNANSGVNRKTTLCAAQYARHCAGTGDLTLVIGQPEGDGKVCEGFPDDEILSAIREIRPDHVVRVGRPGPVMAKDSECADAVCATLDEGLAAALRLSRRGSIVLSVKTWR